MADQKRDYEFTVQISGLDFENKSQLMKLENDEITIVPFASEGLLLLGVEISAKSPLAAWQEFKVFLSASSPEIEIIRIDMDLVSMSQIAERGVKTREAVRLWTKGKRRTGFPIPFTSAGQSLLWAWSDVFKWLPMVETDEKPSPIPLNTIERLNGSLASQRAGADRGWSLMKVVEARTYTTNLGKGAVRVLPLEKGHRDSIKYGEPLSADTNELAAEMSVA